MPTSPTGPTTGVTGVVGRPTSSAPSTPEAPPNDFRLDLENYDAPTRELFERYFLEEREVSTSLVQQTADELFGARALNPTVIDADRNGTLASREINPLYDQFFRVSVAGLEPRARSFQVSPRVNEAEPFIKTIVAASSPRTPARQLSTLAQLTQAEFVTAMPKAARPAVVDILSRLDDATRAQVSEGLRAASRGGFFATDEDFARLFELLARLSGHQEPLDLQRAPAVVRALIEATQTAALSPRPLSELPTIDVDTWANALGDGLLVRTQDLIDAVRGRAGSPAPGWVQARDAYGRLLKGEGQPVLRPPSLEEAVVDALLQKVGTGSLRTAAHLMAALEAVTKVSGGDVSDGQVRLRDAAGAPTTAGWLLDLVERLARPDVPDPAPHVLPSNARLYTLAGAADFQTFRVDDAVQGQSLADCFIIAPLRELAYWNAELRAKAPGVPLWAPRLLRERDGHGVVTLYRRDFDHQRNRFNASFTPVSISVDADFYATSPETPVYAHAAGPTEVTDALPAQMRNLLPLYVEKAFAQTKRMTYESLERGSPAQALEMLLGIRYDELDPEPEGREALFDWVKRAADAKVPMVLASGQSPASTAKLLGIEAEHAFGVFGAGIDPTRSGEQRYVLLRDPRGTGPAEIQGGKVYLDQLEAIGWYLALPNLGDVAHARRGT